MENIKSGNSSLCGLSRAELNGRDTWTSKGAFSEQKFTIVLRSVSNVGTWDNAGCVLYDLTIRSTNDKTQQIISESERDR